MFDEMADSAPTDMPDVSQGGDVMQDRRRPLWGSLCLAVLLPRSMIMMGSRGAGAAPPPHHAQTNQPTNQHARKQDRQDRITTT